MDLGMVLARKDAGMLLVDRGMASVDPYTRDLVARSSAQILVVLDSSDLEEVERKGELCHDLKAVLR